jgi:hypothetical protein
MPGTNAGTGQPISFCCSNCRKGNDYSRQQSRHKGVRMTGKIRPQRNWGHGGARVSQFEMQYECNHCRHIGWSRHIQCERWFLKAGFVLPATARSGCRERSVLHAGNR